MELQSVFKGWDSLDRLYGRCLNRFGAKRTSGLWDRTQSAEAALFCKRKVILCFGRLEGSIIRVFGSRQCVKLVSNACKSWLYQICKLWLFGKFTCLWSKNEKWQRAGLYRLALTLHTLCKLGPKFVDLVCSIRSCSRLKDSIWHKARFWQKWQSYLLLFLD